MCRHAVCVVSEGELDNPGDPGTDWVLLNSEPLLLQRALLDHGGFGTEPTPSCKVA